MPMESPASRRYAEALLEACTKEQVQDLPPVRDELSRFAAMTEESFDLQNVLSNPVIGQDERSAVLDRVMEHMKLSELVRRFLRLVVEKDRMAEITHIAEAFRRLADARAGKVRAYVESAADLSPTASEQLRRALEKRTGKKVEMEITVDPSLIGGLRARVGSLVFDGTIKAELQRLQGRLRATDFLLAK